MSVLVEDKLREVSFKDFGFYAEKFCKIVPKNDKEGAIIPFRLNYAQRQLTDLFQTELDTKGRVWIVVLKARQQGFSTYLQARAYHYLSMRPHKTAFLVTNHSDTTDHLFGMIKQTHDHMVPELRPKVKASNKSELVFKELNTHIRVATAGGKAVGRGHTPKFAWLSELAYWPDAHAKTNLDGFLQGVPKEGSVIIVESTACGVTGPFAELWRNAVAGKNGFTPFFSPWFWSEDYRDPPSDAIQQPGGLTPLEEALVADHGLDLAQLQWRRNKIASYDGDLDRFHVDYPATPDEAFIGTGSNVYNVRKLDAAMQVADRTPPLRREKRLPDGSWVRADQAGELSVYRDIEPNDTYVIGADIAQGLPTGDYSVAQILDNEKRLVATWRGKINPVEFAKVLAELGYKYNEAQIIIENNGPGLVTLSELRHHMFYPNLFKKRTESKDANDETDTLGFGTNKATKPMILARLGQALDTDEITITDTRTLEEMRYFIEFEDGRMGNEKGKGKHDDCVIALALANYAHLGRWRPTVFDDSFYAEAY